MFSKKRCKMIMEDVHTKPEKFQTTDCYHVVEMIFTLCAFDRRPANWPIRGGGSGDP